MPKQFDLPEAVCEYLRLTLSTDTAPDEWEKNQRRLMDALAEFDADAGDGATMIAIERKRQLKEWTAEHDDGHSAGALALAAACYATPVRLHRRREFANATSFEDPFPWIRGDSRMRKGERRENPGNVVPDPATYTTAERLELLVKAGALIAAEIDRINRGEG